MLAYVGSKQYRSLFRPQYESVVNARKLPLKLWSAIRASGMLFSDSLWIWRNPQKALKRVEVQNWDVVETAIHEDHGLVMLTPHLGGFEIIPRVLAQHFPATILYRPSRQEWLNEVVEEGRAYPNIHFVPTNLNGVRQMTRALTRGEAIGILPYSITVSVGYGLGWLAAHIPNSRARVVKTNLRLCFPHLTEIEIDNLALEHWKLFGRSVESNAAGFGLELGTKFFLSFPSALRLILAMENPAS